MNSTTGFTDGICIEAHDLTPRIKLRQNVGRVFICFVVAKLRTDHSTIANIVVGIAVDEIICR